MTLQDRSLICTKGQASLFTYVGGSVLAAVVNREYLCSVHFKSMHSVPHVTCILLDFGARIQRII